MESQIKIRRFEPETDATFLFNVYNDSGAAEFFRRIPRDWKFSDIANIENHTNSIFLTLLLGEVEVLGFAMMSSVDPYGLSCHFGMVLDKQFRDKSFGGTKLAFYVCQRVLDHIFMNTTLRKVIMRFLASREDLKQSLEKGGFHHESNLSEAVHYRGEFRDEVEYAIFKDVFQKMYKDVSCRS